MKDIKGYVDFRLSGLDEDAREEITLNFTDKYHDLIKNNMSEDEAFAKIIRDINDFTVPEEPKQEGEKPKPQQPPVEPVNHAQPFVGNGVFSGEQNKKSQLEKAIVSFYWPMIAFVYVFLSFVTNGWAVTWIIWIFAAAAFAVILFCAGDSGKKDAEGSGQHSQRKSQLRKTFSVCYWAFVLIMFMFASLVLRNLNYTWLIFLVGAAVYAPTQYLLIRTAHKE